MSLSRLVVVGSGRK